LSQKTIYEYTRRDVPDSFELPGPLVDFFLSQVDKYASASDATLQQLRYLRESVFLKRRTPEEAAREALRLRNVKPGSATDLAAFQSFAQDMRSVPAPRSARQD
jgi:Arc/MetJ-type ribon-helix-helix transcriptional regulator